MQVHSDVHLEGVMQRVGLVMNLLDSEEENIDKVLDNINAAHNVGWFLDPTAYRDALYRGDMDEAAELLRALKEPIRVWREKIKPKVVQ
jgi:hypothetical protein